MNTIFSTYKKQLKRNKRYCGAIDVE